MIASSYAFIALYREEKRTKTENFINTRKKKEGKMV